MKGIYTMAKYTKTQRKQAYDKAIRDGNMFKLLLKSHNPNLKKYVKKVTKNDIKSKRLDLSDMVRQSSECVKLKGTDNDTNEMLTEIISDMSILLLEYYINRMYASKEKIGHIRLKDYYLLLPVKSHKDYVTLTMDIMLSDMIGCLDSDFKQPHTKSIDSQALKDALGMMLLMLDVPLNDKFILMNTVYNVLKHTVSFNHVLRNSACQSHT